MRGQGAGKQRNAAGKAGFERLPEDRKTLGQLHAVDPELHIGMLAAHMDLAETVLRDAGHLQHDLVQRRVFALRDRLQRLGPKVIGAGTEARLNLQASGVEFCEMTSIVSRVIEVVPLRSILAMAARELSASAGVAAIVEDAGVEFYPRGARTA